MYVCVCVCVCMHLRACVCVCVLCKCMCTYVEFRGQYQVLFFSYYPQSFFLFQASILTKLGAHDSAILLARKPPGFTFLWLTKLGYRCRLPWSPLFLWMLGLQAQLLAFARQHFTLLPSELSVTVLDNPQRNVRIFESGSIKYGIVCQFIVRLTTASLLLNGFQINKWRLCQSELMLRANTMTEWAPPWTNSEENRLERGSKSSNGHCGICWNQG